MFLYTLVSHCNTEQEICLHYAGRHFRRIDEGFYAKDFPIGLALKRVNRIDTFLRDDVPPDGTLHVWLK